MLENADQVNHWLGLIDGAVVLLLLPLWLLLDDTRAWLRHAAVVAGGALLAYRAAGALSRVGGIGFAMGYRGFFREDTGRRSLDIALAFVGLVAGLLVVAFARNDFEPDDEEEDEEDVEEVEPPEPVSLPTSAWSRTEVLDADATHWDVPEPTPREPRQWPWAHWLEKRRSPSHVAAFPARGVAVPLLAVAVAAGLPVIAVGNALDGSSLSGFGTFDAGVWTILDHVTTSLLAGGALLGAALGIDVWERRLVATAFGIAALGVALNGAVFDVLHNEFWTLFGTGLACGLILPAAVRVLRTGVRLRRSAIVAGVLIAVAAVLANSYVSGRILTSQYPSTVDGD